MPRHFFALRHASIRFVGQGQVMLGATYVEPSSLGIVAALTCHRSFKRVHRFQVSFLGCCAGERDVAYHFFYSIPSSEWTLSQFESGTLCCARNPRYATSLPIEVWSDQLRCLPR